MKDYPSIPSFDRLSARHIARIYKGTWAGFPKLDGSLIRIEWTRKEGFCKFATRHRLIDESDPLFGEAIPLAREGYELDLGAEFRKDGIERAVIFFEFFGPNSFAGNHTVEPHKIILIDVDIYRVGLVSPLILYKLEKLVPCAKALYGGPITPDLLDKVKDGSLPKMPFEGMVFKRGAGATREMFKYKNQAWLEKLKTFCRGDRKKFEELR